MRSSVVGVYASSPLNSGELRTSSGRVTQAPSAVSCTLPQSSRSRVRPSPSRVRPSPTTVQPVGGKTGPITVVHSGSLVFMLTASLEKHEAPPHGHW